MFIASEKLLLCRLAYLELQNPLFEGGSLHGHLEATEDNYKLFSKLAAEDLVYPSKNFDVVAPGTLFSIEVIIPRNRDVFFASSLDNLLNSQISSHYSAPTELYLADTDEVCNATHEPVAERTKSYRQVLKAVSLLKKAADYDDTSSGTLKLVFLQREKLEVPVLYGATALRSLEKVDEWLSLLSGDIHSEQRRTIFRTVLLDALRSVEPAERFVKFLGLFDELFIRFQDNYQLYVAEFSFEKVLAEITQKKLDYILKLNKTFSDIQNQLLAIPVAVILVGGQMEQAGSITTKNAVVYVGVFVFALLMSLLIRNQLDNLMAIGSEISDLRNQFVNKSVAIAGRFNEAYVELRGRERRQRTLIRIVDVVVTAALAGTTYIFFWYSGLLKPLI
jgi:hypothetical protein